MTTLINKPEDLTNRILAVDGDIIAYRNDMVGSNSINFNQATLRKAIEYYLNKELFSSNNSIIVEEVKSDGSMSNTLNVDIFFKTEEKKI
jgi:hypothetical protein